MIVKTFGDIIKEAAKGEDFYNESVEELVDGHNDLTATISTELESRYKECAKDIPVIDKGLVAYKEEMVPVFNSGESYFVEMDNVVKYMTSEDVKDIKEAMTNIAESNELQLSDLSLVIESQDYMESVIEDAIELSKLGDKSLLEECELSIKLINMLKQEGINVVLTK